MLRSYPILIAFFCLSLGMNCSARIMMPNSVRSAEPDAQYAWASGELAYVKIVTGAVFGIAGSPSPFFELSIILYQHGEPYDFITMTKSSLACG